MTGGAKKRNRELDGGAREAMLGPIHVPALRPSTNQEATRAIHRGKDSPTLIAAATAAAHPT